MQGKVVMLNGERDYKMNNSKPTILLIDDDEQFRGLMCEILKENNYTVYEADSGKTGLAYFDEYKPDIVITDIVMPDVEGIEVIMEIRKKSKDIPILAMSGGYRNYAENYLSASKKLGANEIFLKPFDFSDLLSSIERLTRDDT